MKLSKLLYNGEYECCTDINDIHITNITSNINNIEENCAFVLVKGINFDTAKIIDYILAKRPCIIICDNDRSIETDIPIVKVENARRALSIMLSRYYGIEYEKTKFIAVTGTNGKTTTATMIFEIMKHAGYKCGFIGTGKIVLMEDLLTDAIYSMTTPDPDLLYKSIKEMQTRGCEVIVMEVSSHAIALEKIAPITFDHAVFTNLSSEHMDFHKNTEDYYHTKLKLFSQVKCGVFNADDVFSARAMKDCREQCNVTSVGAIWNADAMARDITLRGLDGSTYIYREANLIFKVKLALAGYHNIYNSLLALRCAISFGVRPCVAKEAVANLQSIDGRFEIIKGAPTVIIDYAHTEYAFQNILKSVNTVKKHEQKIITVFGCGGDRDKSKRPLMGRIAEEYSDLVIVTQDNSRSENSSDIISDILRGIEDTSKRKVISCRKSAIRNAILSADDNDIVMILGKGHERYNIDKNGFTYFNEREIIASALSERNTALSKK